MSATVTVKQVDTIALLKAALAELAKNDEPGASVQDYKQSVVNASALMDGGRLLAQLTAQGATRLPVPVRYPLGEGAREGPEDEPFK